MKTEDLEVQKSDGKLDRQAVDVIVGDDKSVRDETESVMTVEVGSPAVDGDPARLVNNETESVMTVEMGFLATDGDPGRLVNMQSPETYGSSSVSPEQNPVFLSSNASPEGLHDETETVTETQDERTPSEIVDLEA